MPYWSVSRLGLCRDTLGCWAPPPPPPTSAMFSMILQLPAPGRGRGGRGELATLFGPP